MSFNVVVGGVVRHVMYCTIPGQTSVTKRDWQCTNISGGSTIGSAAVLANFDSAVGTLFNDQQPIIATYYGSQLYYQTPVGPAPRPESTTANQAPGLLADPLLPTQTSGLLSLYSADLGKAGQGRVYCPFPAAASNDANASPDAAYITGLNNLGTFFTTPRVVVSGGISGTFIPVLYIPGGPPPKPLIRFIARDAWATQRKRGAFGRLNANPF